MRRVAPRPLALADWVRSPDAVALALLVASVAAVFHRALLTSEVFYQRDIHSYWYPQVEVFVRAVAEGSTPLWNPFDGFGAPMLANPASQLLYPPTWLNLVMLPASYYKLFVLAHTVWAGAGLYLLARQLGAGRLAALLAGHAFSLSGPFLSAASLFHHFAGAAWMPWVLLALTRLLARPGLGTALVLGAAGAALLLTGSADVVLMTAMAALVSACSLLATRTDRPSALALALTTLFASLLAVGLAAAQWLPAVVEVTEGWRLRFSPETNLYWSLHPASLLDLLVPSLVSQLPMRDTVRAALFESREPLLASVYLGGPTCYLVLLGLAVRAPWHRGLLVGFVAFLACALGRHAFVLPWLLHLPGFSIVRYPTKYLWGASLFWALLVAGGALAWGRPWSVRDRRWGAWVGLAMALLAATALSAAACVWGGPDRLAPLVNPGRADAATLSATAHRLAAAGVTLGVTAALAWWRATREEATRRAQLALAAFVVLDLGLAGRYANRLAPAELMTHRPPFADQIEPGARIQVIAPPNRSLRQQLVRGPEGWAPEWSWALGGIDLMIPPMGARWGLRGGYDGDYTGLAPRAYSELVALVRSAEGTPRGRVMLERAGVNDVVTLREGDLGGLQERGRAESVFATPLRLLRVPDTLPVAHVVEGLRAVSGEAALRLFPDPRFDMRREALLEPGEPEAAAGDGFVGTARLVERRSDALVIEAELNRPGLLVVLEAFRQGWQAEVKGRTVPVIRANAIFRGVRLGAGQHVVQMSYRPWAPIIGLAVTGFSILAFLGLWSHARRRPAPAPAPPAGPDQ